MKEREFHMKIHQENGPPITGVNKLLKWEILTDMLAETLIDFSRLHGGHGISETNQEGRMLLEFCDLRHLCIANTWLRKS